MTTQAGPLGAWTIAWRGGCCIKPSRKSCCAIAEGATRAARSYDLETDVARVTNAMADFGTQP